MSDETAGAGTEPLTVSAALGGDVVADNAGAPTTDNQAAPDTQAEPGIKLPGKDSTPEQWSEFYKSIGAPDSADAYELPLPEGDDGAFAKTASEWFKDAGLLPQQAQALAVKWNEFQAAQAQAMQQAEAERIKALDSKNRAEEASLKNEWGANHAANMEFARRAARQFLPSDKSADIITALESSVGFSETIKILHNIGKGLAEHDAPGLGQPSGSGAQKSIADILYGGSVPN